MLVGLGEAGKTSLVKSLFSASQNKKTNLSEIPELTDGIEINDWDISLQDKSTLTFSVWDFGK